jgi:hypothetical protein
MRVPTGSDARNCDPASSRNWPATAAATPSARWVLPTPPGPVSVSSETSSRSSRSRTVAISRSHPISEARDRGMAERRLSAGDVVMAGHGRATKLACDTPQPTIALAKGNPLRSRYAATSTGKIAFQPCERSCECPTTERLSNHVLDSRPLSRECALSADCGGKPGGVADKTHSGAISVGGKPDRLGGSRRARRRHLVGSQCNGAGCRRHQPTNCQPRCHPTLSRPALPRYPAV